MMESGAKAALGYRRQDAGNQQRESPEPLRRVDELRAWKPPVRRA